MKRIAVATLLFFTTALIAPATSVVAQGQGQGQAASSPITVPVTGSGGGSTFTGALQIQRFATQQGQVVATGLLTGTVTSATGVATSVVKTVALPATIVDSTCEILHLDLGPLAIDLLGLQINLSRVVLDITAQAGAGNLLGNLLCGVANLLNNPTGLAQILNRILDILG